MFLLHLPQGPSATFRQNLPQADGATFRSDLLQGLREGLGEGRGEGRGDGNPLDRVPLVGVWEQVPAPLPPTMTRKTMLV